MDNSQNSGSFMAPAGGGGSALQEAIARRSPALNQNTQDPQAAAPVSVPQPSSGMPPVQGGGAPAPAPMTPSAPAPVAAGGMPPSAGNPEAQLILKAQNSYLQSLAKIQEAQAGLKG